MAYSSLTQGVASALVVTLWLALVTNHTTASASDQGGESTLRPSDEVVLALGLRIWRNEGAMKESYLTWWNEGEAFASLGIGHFIWYPAGRRGRFTESFPAALQYLMRHGVTLPPWLEDAMTAGCPWPDRETFLRASSSTRLTDLRRLLADTVALQARFITARLEPALARITAATPPARRPVLAATVNQLASSAQGLYALVDYLNFKGDGTNPDERYRAVGWGLMQVLEQTLTATGPQDAALVDRFADAAVAVLEQRVRLSPQQWDEGRWLAGWKARIDTYRQVD